MPGVGSRDPPQGSKMPILVFWDMVRFGRGPKWPSGFWAIGQNDRIVILEMIQNGESHFGHVQIGESHFGDGPKWGRDDLGTPEMVPQHHRTCNHMIMGNHMITCATCRVVLVYVGSRLGYYVMHINALMYIKGIPHACIYSHKVSQNMTSHDLGHVQNGPRPFWHLVILEMDQNDESPFWDFPK